MLLFSHRSLQREFYCAEKNLIFSSFWKPCISILLSWFYCSLYAFWLHMTNAKICLVNCSKNFDLGWYRSHRGSKKDRCRVHLDLWAWDQAHAGLRLSSKDFRFQPIFFRSPFFWADALLHWPLLDTDKVGKSFAGKQLFKPTSPAS